MVPSPMAQQAAASPSPGTEGSEMGHQHLSNHPMLGSQFVSPQTPFKGLTFANPLPTQSLQRASNQPSGAIGARSV